MQTAEKVFWIGPKPDILIAEIQGDKKRKEADVNEDIAFLKDQMGDRKMSIGKEDQRYTFSASRSKKKKITPEDAATELNESVSSVSSRDISEDGEKLKTAITWKSFLIQGNLKFQHCQKIFFH